MAKLFTYVIITIGLVVLFNAAGFQTAGSIVMEQLGIDFGNIENFRLGTLFTSFLVAAIGGLLVSGVVALTLGRGNPEIGVTALYATPLIALVGDMIALIAFGGTNFAGYIIFLIMGPLIAGYVITLYDWVRGRD